MINKVRTGLTALSDRLKIRRDPVGFARSLGVRIGHDCRLIGFQRFTFGSEPYLITLGDHVTITGGVQFIPHDGGVWVFRDRCPDIELMGPITIGSNVFIGMNSIIMPGVTIGDNCIVGAGAVVTRDIPAGTVAVGVPARPIKTLDEYWNKIKDQAVHTRALAEPEKRRTLEEHFGLPVSG